MKDFRVLYIIADMGNVEDKNFLMSIGLFIKNNEEIKLIVEDKDGVDHVLIFLSAYQINTVKHMFSAIEWNYVIEDITSNYLYEAKLPVCFSDGFSEERYTKYLENFRRENLTKDDILDLILKKGYIGINELEREILLT
jgi:hypothetical protein